MWSFNLDPKILWKTMPGPFGWSPSLLGQPYGGKVLPKVTEYLHEIVFRITQSAHSGQWWSRNAKIVQKTASRATQRMKIIKRDHILILLLRGNKQYVCTVCSRGMPEELASSKNEKSQRTREQHMEKKRP